MRIKESIVEKDPWLAVFLSWRIFPGLGQIYAGQIQRGLFIGSFFLVSAASLTWLIMRPAEDFLDNHLLQLVIALILLSLVILNYFDAHRCARKANGYEELSSISKQDKNPWVAVILSRIVPGLGHIYARRRFLGILFFILLFDLKYNSDDSWIYLILSVFIDYHAYLVTPTSKAKSKDLIKIVLLCSLMINLLLPTTTDIVDLYFVSFDSMDRYSYMFDERIIVNKLTYRLKDPQRQDVVVFRKSEYSNSEDENIDEFAICRLIGLPGETVRIQGHSIYINNQLLEEDEDLLTYSKETQDFQLKKINIPSESYFVAGDKRYHPNCQKVIAKQQIVGKAVKRIRPFKKSELVQ